jgi:CheY-like chemotaxis protein
MQPRIIKFCQTPKILIIDDDDSQRRLLRKLIGGTFECDILEACDGLDALMLLFRDKQRPDLILLDLIMPCLNGVEFLQLVRGRPEFDNIPVVVCTSVAETREIKGLMSDWIHSYLVKPINRTKLVDKLVAALGRLMLRVDYHD